MREDNVFLFSFLFSESDEKETGPVVMYSRLYVFFKVLGNIANVSFT